MQEIGVEYAMSKSYNGDMYGKYLTFFTEDQLYGVAISDVVQIVGIQQITAIPEFPDYAKGIINLRGIIIPVIDMRLRLGKEEKGYDERTCIIVTLIKDVAIGFIVDAVDSVTSISDNCISTPPELSGEDSQKYVSGIARHEEKVVLLLDLGRILSSDIATALATGTVTTKN